MAKSALSAKALRAAAPIQTLPYQIVRKYGEPVLSSSLEDVRKRLLKDLDDCYERAKRIGSKADRVAILGARSAVARGLDELPLKLNVVVDEHTGTRYQVEVVKRG